jgi:molecular chaperone GrpE (heat shock protein)
MDQQINDQRRQALMQVGELQTKLDFAEKRIAELERHADIQSRLLADMADEQGRLQRELADAQDYAAELEAAFEKLEAEK